MLCRKCDHFMDVFFKYGDKHYYTCLLHPDVFNIPDLSKGNVEKAELGPGGYLDLARCSKYKEQETSDE